MDMFLLPTEFDCGVIHFDLVTHAAPSWVNLSIWNCIWMTAAEIWVPISLKGMQAAECLSTCLH